MRPMNRGATRRRVGAVLLLVVTTVATYSLTRDSGRCSPWRWRDVEIGADEYAAGADYASTRSLTMPGIVGRITGRDGLALPGFVAVLKEHVDDTSLLAHETVHLHQMRRDGLIPFAANYLRDLSIGVWYGCDAYYSYMAVTYERHAYIVGNTTAARERRAEVAETIRQLARAGVTVGARQQ